MGLADLLVESGQLAEQAEGQWQPTDWIYPDRAYRASELTQLRFNYRGTVVFEAGSEFSLEGRHRHRLRLTQGRLSTETLSDNAISLLYGDVLVGSAASTGGQAILTATPDRIVVERGSMTVQYPTTDGKRRKHLYLREGVEYLFTGGEFLPQDERTIPPAAVTTPQRVVWHLDLTDADAVAKLLVDGELIRHDGRPVLSSVPGPKRGPQDARLLTLDLSKIDVVARQSKLALRYRYFTENGQYVYGTGTGDLVFPQVNWWTTYTGPPLKLAGLLKTIQWRHSKKESPLLIDRLELVEVPWRLPESVWPKGDARETSESQSNPEVDKLTQLLASADGTKRLNIVRDLMQLGREKAPTAAMLAVLKIARDDEDEEVATNAFHAIAEIGEESEDAARLALPSMMAYLDDRNNPAERRALAARAIGEIGEKRSYLTKISAAVATLAKALEDKDPEVAEESLRSLGEIGEKNPTKVADVIPAITGIAEGADRNGLKTKAEEVLKQIKAGQ